MKNKSDIQLATEKIPKLILKYSATTLTSLIFYNLYTLADTMFVSWGVGNDAVGGISVAFPVVIVLSAISTALGGGAAALISRKLGENDRKAGGNIALNAMIAFWISAIITTALGLIFMEPMLNTLGVTPETYQYSKSYLTIVLIGCVFSTGFSSIIRAEGKMKYALLIWIIPVSANVVLDALFVLVFHWGVAGSAIATVCCQFISFSMSIFFFWKISSLEFKGAKISWKTVSGIFSIGMPSIIQQMALALSFMLMNNVLKMLNGTVAINVFAYVSKIVTFVFLPFTAVLQAMSPIIGYNFGAKSHKRTRETIVTATLMSCFYGMLSCLVLVLFPNALLAAFSCKGEVLEQGIVALRIIALGLPTISISMTFGVAYQTIGRKKKSIVMFASIIAVLIPALLFMSKLIGISGVWWSFTIASVFSAVFSLIIVSLDKSKKMM